MKCHSKTFGKIGSLKAGDLVHWRGFGLDHIGVVQKFISRPIGGREVVYAVVFAVKEERFREILCLSLKKLEIPEFSYTEN
jgi:uncharacterized protein YijF (DUF1287 family)